MKRGQSFYLFVLCYWVGLWMHGQAVQKNSLSSSFSETGNPFSHHYSPEDYKGLNQNWGVVQDSLGILYFANGGGVLSYDGVNWELLTLPGQSHTKSIAIDKNNRIYVGATGEFGYLEPEANGKIKYVSLSSLIKSKIDFTVVYSTYATPDGVFFQTNEAIIRWKNGEFKIWPAIEGKFHNAFWVNNSLLIGQKNMGLMQIIGDDIQLVPHGSFFANKGIQTLWRQNNGQFLIGTYESFFLYDENGVKLFPTELDVFLKDFGLYSGIELRNGTFAIAGWNEGMAIMDRQGKEIFSSTNKEVLPSSVLKFFQDKEGILWAGLDFGISKIEIPSPFSQFQNFGVDDRTLHIVRFQGKLYVGTPNGLYQLDNNPDGSPIFKNVQGIKGRIWGLFEFGDRMLVSTLNDEGSSLLELKSNIIRIIGKEYLATSFLRSKLDVNRVFVARDDGLSSLYFSEGQWIDEGMIREITSGTYSIGEEISGNLWLSTSGNQIWRVSFKSKDSALRRKNFKIDQFGSEHGLPEEVGAVHVLGNSVFYAVNSKLSFEFDSENNRFVPDKFINKIVGKPKDNIYLIEIDNAQNIFFSINNPGENSKLMVAWKKDTLNYVIQDLKMDQYSKSFGEPLYYDKDSVIWYAGVKGVIREDLKLLNYVKNDDQQNKALINKVAYKSDSMIVLGAYKTNKVNLPFKNNSFRFEYTAPSYQEEKANKFQYKLTGFDDNWSNWSLETKKDYTNLSEGNYTFSVRAKNIFGEISQQDSYSFTILPPWYRTWWAYLGYSILAIMLLLSFNRLRSQQLRNKNMELEAIISDRTEELRNKNELLEQQTEKLKEMDSLKTHLFANISHEFRTPLTLIKGPIEKLEESKKNEMSNTDIIMIRRNANRLLGLVNQLLDLSKIDGGKMQLNPSEGDVFKCIRAAVSAFGSHAVSRNIDFQINVPSTSLWASFDRDKLEKIMYNLLSNAFKFTPDGSRIELHARHHEHALEFEIADTGQGIKKENLPHIFDRFYQVDDSYTKENSGTGIGLALTKELVLLMKGTLSVESELGKGTIFMVGLPMEEIRCGQIDDIDYPRPTEYDQLFETAELVGKLNRIKLSKVLVIEDNNDMRYYIKEQLSQDYEIMEASNGKEGFLKASKLMPDLIITDLMMPQMDGFTLCKKLKTDISTSHIPIIMLTAKAGIENKLEGLENGADEYLTKPFNAKELQLRVKNLIRQRQELRKLFSKNSSLEPKDMTVTSLDEKFLTKVLFLLETKHSDPDFGVPQMQRELGMGKTQLHMKIKALTNEPPGEFLRNFRLKRATQLLSKKSDTFSQVAYSVGFNSLSYFTKCFKEFYGTSPSAYFNKKK